jgi:uncharacterized protein (DUF2267 family)
MARQSRRAPSQQEDPTMKHGEFIKHVHERAGVPKDLAETLTRVTLETLADRLAGGEPHDLASQLPHELQDYVRPSSKVTERFGVEEFVSRVAAAAKVDGETARRGVRAVLITVREAVSPGEWHDVMAQLPSEYSQIAEPATA